MARIASVVIPSDKQVWIALTYVYGIGRTTSKKILAEAKIEPTTRVKDLTEADEQKINDIISAKYHVEGDLRRLVSNNIKRLKDINSLIPPSITFDLTSSDNSFINCLLSAIY